VRTPRFYRSGDNGEARRIGRNVVALLVLSAAAAVLLAERFKLGVPAELASLVVGGGAPAGLYMTWESLRQSSRTGSPGGTPAGEAGSRAGTVLERLARVIEKQWDEEYQVRMFNDPAQKFRDIRASWTPAGPTLTVSWAELTGVARGHGWHKGVQPQRWAVEPDGLAGLDEQDLRGVLEKVPTGWLVVLGESGSGKTLLMIRTVLEIIRHRSSGDPVPVFLPMTSWDPKNDSLRVWLEKQLRTDYGALGANVTVDESSTTLGALLLDQQLIVPVLDGLDEMPAGTRVAAVNRLNEAFTAPARPLRLMVTCRTGDYRQAVGKAEDGWNPNPVQAAAAIELQTLDADKVSSYLGKRGTDPRWAAVDEQLRQPASPLAEALNTPLYASLASEIYNPTSQLTRGRRRPPAELCTVGDAQSVRQHLLDEFIPAVYAKERAAQAKRAAEEGDEPRQLAAERWLMILADYLTPDPDQPATSLQWWNLDALAPRWLVPGAIGVVCGIAAAVTAVTGTHVGVGIGVGFGTGVLIAVSIGLGTFELHRRRDTARLGRGRLSQQAWNRRYSRRRPGPGMTGGLLGAVAGALLAGLAARHHLGHQASLFSGLPVGFGVALGGGASTNFTGGFAGALIGTFAGGCLEGVGLGLPAGLVNGLGVAVAVALIIARVGRHKPSRQRPKWDREVGLAGGCVVGLAIGLIVGREAGDAYGIASGVLMAAAAAPPFGLRHVDENLEEVPSPSQALARDAKAFRLTALTGGLAAGVAGFIAGGMTSIVEVQARADVSSVLRDGIGIGLSSALVVGLTFGFYHAATPEFRIITWWLALRRRAPWRFNRFLEEAHHLAVLRQSGAVYQFRHLELQLRLAARFRDGQAQPAPGRPARTAGVRNLNQAVPSPVRETAATGAGLVPDRLAAGERHGGPGPPGQDGPQGQARQDRAGTGERAGREHRGQRAGRADRQDRARGADRQDRSGGADRQDGPARADAQERTRRAFPLR
jgi:hypothetical protein